jgi:mgtE-like transporter
MLSSRLSTGLHLGTTAFALTDRSVWSDVLGVVALALTVFAILGVAATAVGQMAGGTLPLSVTLAVTVTSGMLLAGVVIVVSLVATYAAYRSGADPDDVVVPVVTNVCDASGILILTWVVLAVV